MNVEGRRQCCKLPTDKSLTCHSPLMLKNPSASGLELDPQQPHKARPDSAQHYPSSWEKHREVDFESPLANQFSQSVHS